MWVSIWRNSTIASWRFINQTPPPHLSLLYQKSHRNKSWGPRQTTVDRERKRKKKHMQHRAKWLKMHRRCPGEVYWQMDYFPHTCIHVLVERNRRNGFFWPQGVVGGNIRSITYHHLAPHQVEKKRERLRRNGSVRSVITMSSKSKGEKTMINVFLLLLLVRH